MRNRNRNTICWLLVAVCFTASAWQVEKPHVFLLGDSISIHYGPYLKSYVEDFAELEQKKIETLGGREFSRNGGDSKRVLEYLTYKLKEKDFQPDYLLLNCGLHDVGRDTVTGDLQVPLVDYRQNLEKIVKLIQAKNIQIIWVSITPVVDSIHNSRSKHKWRYVSDLASYNLAALEICRKQAIPVIDLFSFTGKLGTDAYLDNVHYKEYARQLQAACLAGALQEILMKKNRQGQ